MEFIIVYTRLAANGFTEKYSFDAMFDRHSVKVKVKAI